MRHDLRELKLFQHRRVQYTKGPDPLRLAALRQMYRRGMALEVHVICNVVSKKPLSTYGTRPLTVKLLDAVRNLWLLGQLADLGLET